MSALSRRQGLRRVLDADCRPGYDPDVASRQRISVNSTRNFSRGYVPTTAEANVSEGEIVERALRVADLRALVAQTRSRSDLDAEAATQLVREELEAARGDARNRAA